MTEADEIFADVHVPVIQDRHGRTVVYARGQYSVSVVAVHDEFMLAGLTDLGDVEGQFHDEKIVKADLILNGSAAIPAEGDTITVGGVTYEVSAAEKDGFCFEEMACGTMWRIHVKH